MSKFDRYLLRTLLISTFVTLIFLLGIDFLVQSSDEADNLGVGKYSFLVMIYVLALQIPDKIIEFLPAAILVGSIMGLGQLGNQNELTVVRAAGVSKLRLSRAGILMAFFLGIGLIGISEYIAPGMNDKAELTRNQALGRASANHFAQGIWLDSGEDGYVHIAQFNPDGSLGGLSFYQQDREGNIRIDKVRRAEHQGDYWQLSDSYSIMLNSTRYQLGEGRNTWHNSVNPQTLSRLADTSSAQTIAELYTLTQFLKANRIEHRNESLRLWQQLFLPLSTLAMLLLALPFAYGQVRSGGGGARLLIGILLGVSYYVLQAILSSMALLLHWPPILGALLPILILGIPPFIALLRN